MRRTIFLAAVIALVLATVGAPASARPKDYPLWETWCDLDGDADTGTGTVEPPLGPEIEIELDGREEVPDQYAVHVPGWMEGINVPAHFQGGTIFRWVQDNGGWVEDDLFDVTFDWRPPGLDKNEKITYCLQYAYIGPYFILWDPVWVFFPNPAIPPTNG